MKINSFFGIAVCFINCFFTFAYDELDIKTPKESGNKNISNRRFAGEEEQIEAIKKKKENNVFNYLKSLNDNFQIFQNLKDKEPINFKKRVFQNFKSEFDQLNPSDIRPSHISILKPSAKSLEAIEGGWGYKPLEERTGIEKNIVFGHILNKDILKKMVDENYIDAADAADIMVKNKEIAAFLLNVLKKNKNKLLEPTFKFETGNLAVKKVSQADRERYNNEKRDRKELYKKFEKQLTDIIEN